MSTYDVSGLGGRGVSKILKFADAMLTRGGVKLHTYLYTIIIFYLFFHVYCVYVTY